MEILILPQHWISVLAICIMIGTLLVAYVKKMLMTYMIIIANLIIFIITLVFHEEIIGGGQYAGLGFRPIYLTLEFSPQIYTLFTSMFIHGSFLHIFGNMLVFFFMGMAFEERVGWKKFLTIYLITGACGALSHSLFNLDTTITLIGASGAIFGILGAFAFSYPRDEVVMPIPVGILLITRVKVVYAAVLFAAIETVFVYFGVQDQTAHFAHLGGLVSGVILAALLIRSKRETRDAYANGHSYPIDYEPTKFQRPRTTDFLNLEKLAQTKEQKEMIDRIKRETVPQVQKIWIDHFLENAECPNCKKPLKFNNRKIWCEKCGFTTVL